MAPVYAIASNITSSLGLTTAQHWQAVVAGKTGIHEYHDASLSNTPFWSAKLAPPHWQVIHTQTKAAVSLSPFEQLALYSAKQALQECDEELNPADTLVILSTTKGNIELLEQVPDERLLLHTSAGIIADALGFNQNKPHVVSHACVSGVLALTYAQRLLQAGKYKHAIVIGCDRFTKFVLSGFQSFHAIANEPCKPFDADRKGINLGESGSTIILSTQPGSNPMARIMSGATSNDANHISGPSRTGEELALAINSALQQAGITSKDISAISAHGTATSYNDEMESKAFGLCGLENTPVHSFKGYTGHTLGAAGILESAMIIESIRHQQLIPSLGFQNIGVSVSLNVTTALQDAEINYVLKAASGFGGCNATAVWAKA
jgi:3-oxoacyl-[acyl-carrier-protein] synthase-1